MTYFKFWFFASPVFLMYITKFLMQNSIFQIYGCSFNVFAMRSFSEPYIDKIARNSRLIKLWCHELRKTWWQLKIPVQLRDSRLGYNSKYPLSSMIQGLTVFQKEIRIIPNSKISLNTLESRHIFSVIFCIFFSKINSSGHIFFIEILINKYI